MAFTLCYYICDDGTGQRDFADAIKVTNELLFLRQEDHQGVSIYINSLKSEFSPSGGRRRQI